MPPEEAIVALQNRDGPEGSYSVHVFHAAIKKNPVGLSRWASPRDVFDTWNFRQVDT